MSVINKYTEEIKNNHKEISDFFGFHIESINIVVAENRIEYEKLLGRKTAEWEVGHTNLNKKTVLLLDPAQWEKDALSHKPEEFSLLVKHELVHIYIDNLSKGKVLPMWLIEGLSGAISGQYKNSKVRYFETDFCSKLDTPFNWNQRTSLGYPTAFLFTHYLIEKYGIRKLEQLIKSSSIYYSYYLFNKNIANIFGKNLTELEQEFLNVFE